MPRVCTICAASDRASIDSELAAGQPMRRIAARYGVSESSIARHRRSHLSPAIAAVVARREGRRAERLVDRVERVVDEAEAILAAAKESGRVTAALAAVRELRSLLELVGRLTGELDDRPQLVVNLQASTEWLAVRAAILDALLQFPEARLAVAARLAALGGSSPLTHQSDGTPHATAVLALPSAGEESAP